ncbi:uncharacterized protein [Littorina saxatilis]|uniref:uncharacterized protein isoform X3 n=1 Tax=Littorina saxatilis TaxID=31220 RepID=UPI0038B46540
MDEVVVSAQNLADLQNYLSTFNKEIEGADPSSMPVITDADGSESVNDILASVSVSVAQSLHSGVDSSGAGHFSTAFYTEQSLLDSGLGEDSSQNMHSLVTGVDAVDSDLVTQIKQEASGIDLDDASMAAVQAQLASLTGSMSDMTSSQELIMTSVNDSLDGHEGKVIRIVSLSQDGSILSLGDGSHMQIMDDDSSQVGSEIKDLSVTLESLGQPLVMSSSSQDLLDQASSSSSTTSATVTSSNVDLLTVDGLGEGPSDQLVDSGVQHQLIAVHPTMEGLSAETLQALTLSSDFSNAGPLVLNAANTLQTLAIVPSEGQNGEVNYVLVVAQPDGTNKELAAQGISLDMNSVLGLKEEASELTEEYVEEGGTIKRILKITPRKMISSLNSELTCTYCNYTSPKRYLLTRHMKSHSEDRPHKCDICQRGFKTYASLTNHVNTHTGIRPHKCKECDAAFTTSGELVRHVRYRHTFEKPHKCPECDYASVELSKLKRHLRSHTGERPYQCPNCSYASPDTYKLKRHMRIHTGEKPYVCDICNARFTQSNSLKAHKLIHSGNKPVFQCEFCPTTCGRKTDLKIHMQKLHYSEEPVTCRKCGESFPDRYNFKLHWKTHEGEKSYKCDECDYAACSQRHLESHILTHSGEKPFECDECDHAFRQKQLLKRHKNHHHTSDYHPPTPKDKNHDCGSCEKSFAHKGEGGLRTITADHILHGDLMQEWREGKLGNAPQVVIVHPDGRIEEVTPKLQLPPDRSVDKLLSVVGAGSSKESSTEPSGEEKRRMSMSGSGSRPQKRIIVTVPQEGDVDEDGNQREVSTQVELASDSSDDESDTHLEQVETTEHFLSNLGQSVKSSGGSNLSAVLDGSGVTLYPAGSSDLESMIASLPMVSTPMTIAEQPSVSQDHSQIQTIDAPEILAHLDFTTKLIKQEKVDPPGQEHISISLVPHPASQPRTVVAGRSQSEATMVVNAGRAITSSFTTMTSVPKTVTVVVGSAGDPADRRTRSMKRKDEEDRASPAKRTRKALAEQRYTYI